MHRSGHCDSDASRSGEYFFHIKLRMVTGNYATREDGASLPHLRGWEARIYKQ
jgi:hypothetical protein